MEEDEWVAKDDDGELMDIYSNPPSEDAPKTKKISKK